MIALEEVEQQLREHDRRVKKKSDKWRQYRAAWKDEFWSERPIDHVAKSSSDTTGSKVQIEINDIRPWVRSFTSSLFYKGLQTFVEPDAVIRKKSDESQGPGDTTAIRNILDRFLQTADMESAAGSVYEMALMYGGPALMLGLHPIDEDGPRVSPVDRIWCEAIPPWECMWDPKSPPGRHRYIGRVHWMSKEEVEELYGIPEDLEPTYRPDPLDKGKKENRGREDESYFRILEYYDLTARHEVDDEVSVRGQLCIFAVTNPDSTDNRSLRLLKKMAMPYDDYAGRPLVPILPAPVEALPEAPLDPVAPVGSVYELTKERNYTSTYMANAMRRDVARVMLHKSGSFTPKNLDDIQSGVDCVLVEVEDQEGGLGETAQWLKQQPVSPTVLQYQRLLEEGRGEVKQTADLARGTAGQYMTATEAGLLASYTESTVGEIAKAFNKVVVSACELYLRILRSAMKEQSVSAIKVRSPQLDPASDPESDRVVYRIVRVTREMLERRWIISVADTASTPVAAQNRRNEFVNLIPALQNLMTMASNEQLPSVLRVFGQKAYEHLSDLSDLPRSMRYSLMEAEATAIAPPAPPPAPPGPPAGPAGPPQEGPPIDPEVANRMAAALEAPI